MRSWRSAARKVSVRQWPCGTLATQPLAPRHSGRGVRVMLVLAQVSSMKTSRRDQAGPDTFFHRARRRATSGRSCSLACRLFFEADAFAREEVPDRVVARPRCRARRVRPARPRSVRSGCSPRSAPAASPARRPARSAALPPIGLAAALPVARNRCDHFTTLAHAHLETSPPLARQL